MKYDPVKKVFGNIVARNVFLRTLFYRLLDIMFLRSWHVRKTIKSLFSSSETLSIFDAGMGFGQYSYFMAKRYRNAKIFGVDVKDEQVNDCNYFFTKRQFKNVKFKVADLTTIDYKNEYDFILNVDVMEHIVEDELVLKNFANALKSGGRLLINTPSDLGGSDAHDEQDESFIEEHARNGYSKEEITAKLERSGLKVTYFKYTYGKFGTISWRFGIKYPILIAGVSKIFILLLPLYYLFTLWFILILMRLDVAFKNDTGTGIIVVAQKQ